MSSTGTRLKCIQAQASKSARKVPTRSAPGSQPQRVSLEVRAPTRATPGPWKLIGVGACHEGCLEPDDGQTRNDCWPIGDVGASPGRHKEAGTARGGQPQTGR